MKHRSKLPIKQRCSNNWHFFTTVIESKLGLLMVLNGVEMFYAASERNRYDALTSFILMASRRHLFTVPGAVMRARLASLNLTGWKPLLVNIILSAVMYWSLIMLICDGLKVSHAHDKYDRFIGDRLNPHFNWWNLI